MSEQLDTGAKYLRTITGYDGTAIQADVYLVLEAFPATPAVQHALKKLLCGGKREGKSYAKDIEEAIVSLQKELKIEAIRNKQPTKIADEILESLQNFATGLDRIVPMELSYEVNPKYASATTIKQPEEFKGFAFKPGGDHQKYEEGPPAQPEEEYQFVYEPQLSTLTMFSQALIHESPQGATFPYMHYSGVFRLQMRSTVDPKCSLFVFRPVRGTKKIPYYVEGFKAYETWKQAKAGMIEFTKWFYGEKTE